MSKNNRINIIDEARGALIILVVVFHLLYDLAVMYKVAAVWDIFSTARFFEPILPFMFILISGICFQLSRSNLKRGLILAVVAAAITLVTWIAAPDFIILFGMIHFLALVHLLFAPLKKAFNKIPLKLGLLICGLCVVLFVMTYNLQYGYLGIDGFFKVELPKVLYQSNALMMLGFHTADFSSSDYFTVFPWVFIFIIGIILGKYVHKLPEALKKPHIPPLAFLGRHTLIIYIAHQPIIYGVLWLIMNQ